MRERIKKEREMENMQFELPCHGSSGAKSRFLGGMASGLLRVVGAIGDTTLQLH